MKKIDAILSGKDLTENKIALRKRKFNRVFEAMKDSAESQKEDATIAYDQLVLSLANDSKSVEGTLRSMLEKKQIIMAADNTLKALEAIKADLEEEVEE